MVKKASFNNYSEIDLIQHEKKILENEDRTPIFERTIISLKYLMGEFCLYTARFYGYRIQSNFLNPMAISCEKVELFKNMDLNRRCLLVSNVSADNLNTGIRLIAGTIRYIYSIVPLYYVMIQGTFEDYLGNNFKKKLDII